MARWYAGRREVKRTASIQGDDKNAIVDRLIEEVSALIERETRRTFIPQTKTNYYRWPPLQASRYYILWINDDDLLSVTTLQTKAQDSSPTTISSDDYFLEPANKTPKNRIEIDLSSSASFDSGDTPQRSILVTGSWGYSNDTKSGGTVSSGLSADATATSCVVSDGSLIDVGNTLLIESEQIFVSEITGAQVGSEQLTSGLDANPADTSVPVTTGTNWNIGEVIRVDSEEMFITAISSNTLTVQRAYNSTVLASHSSGTAVHGFRTLTIQRGMNGTTAATHADTTAISIYIPPAPINQWCREQVVATYHQEQAGWGRTIGAGDGATEFRGTDLKSLIKCTKDSYQRPRIMAV